MALDRRRSVRDRGSVRSRGSSSASSSDPREKLKDCCRQFVAFMFTQVGVGALVVSYAIMGAFAFMAIEGESENSENNDHVAHLRSSCLSRLWNVTDHLNVLEERKWKLDVRQVLLDHQQAMALAIKGGYDGRTNQERWTFPSALMFSLSVFTMIGFGHLVPRTQWGKIATMLYAVFGIPVYVLYFMNMGQVLASCFKWFYCKLVRCADARKDKPLTEPDPSALEGNKEIMAVASPTTDDQLSDDLEDESDPGLVIVPSTACLWVWLTYLAAGTIMFAEWENWEYLDACYFCVTSLCKIGMGDFVPGANLQASSNQTKLIINFVYLLVGMGIIAMCYNLMKEEILVRLRELKADLIERYFLLANNKLWESFQSDTCYDFEGFKMSVDACVVDFPTTKKLCLLFTPALMWIVTAKFGHLMHLS